MGHKLSLINKEMVMLPPTSRGQQYHLLHKYSPVDCAFVIGGQRRMGVPVLEQAAGGKGKKESK